MTQDRDETKNGAEPRPVRARRGARPADGEHSAWGEKLIAGVPARIMRPRLVFIACLIAVVGFGLLMVYSASSVEALQEEGSSYYYLFRQAALTVAGTLLAGLVIAGVPFNLQSYMGRASTFLWVVIVISLVVVLVLGAASHGAVRWINLGFFTLQPSEFAKPAIILVAARIMTEFYEKRAYDNGSFLLALGFAVLIPLGLIFAQPDLGTTAIIGATVFIMMYLSGIPYKTVGICLVVVAVLVGAAIAAAPYRMARLLAVSDPWSDPYGTGYQATLAIMAFASGGLFGRGIGNSTMKYNYLPEAHNDYILAIIGEELGFVGTVLFFLVFMGMIYAGFKIAERCPKMQGRLIAYGCTTILAIQFFVNALGILGITPMTGKTMPFISYGGSSMMASLILAGLIIRVSIESNPRTIHDARRESIAVVDEGAAPDTSSHMGRSTAGEPRTRSGRTQRSGFSVYDGGARPSDAAPRNGGARPSDAAPRTRPRPTPRRSTSSSGYERVNLNDNPSERLRSRGQRPRVDHDAADRARGGGRRRGDAPGSKGRGRYDR